MDALPLTITDAGFALIIDADSGGLDAITIAEVGLTNTAFEADPAMTALPDEIKRVDAVSGIAADPRTVYLTVRDSSEDAYEFNGYGVYTSDGTLFAVYSQEDAIAAKASVSMLYLAVDLKLDAEVADIFEFGDANFLNPPATVETAGVARLATLEEVQAAESDDTIVTPALLAAVYVALAQLGVANGVATLGADGKLAAAQRPAIDAIDVFPVVSEAEMLALDGTPGDFAVRTDLDPTKIFILQQPPASDIDNWIELNTPAPVTSVNGKAGTVVLIPSDIGAVPTGRKVEVGGLATGGGDLSADRTITVPKASPAETSAGEIDNKAVTPLGLAAALLAVGAGVPMGRQITGAGLVGGGGDLSADRVLTVLIASAAEAWAATNNSKALTPASLATVKSEINAKVPTARQITGDGLATGGGSLSENRSITVPKASAAEVLAGSSDSKAVTPASLSGLISVTGSGSTMVIKFGAAIIQIFSATANADGSTTVTLPESFPSTCVGAWFNGGRADTGQQDNGPYVSGRSASSVTLFSAIGNAVSGQVLAIGR